MSREVDQIQLRMQRLRGAGRLSHWHGANMPVSEANLPASDLGRSQR